MFEFINFKEEAAALTKWLISIPSVTTTHGEIDIVDAVYKTLGETAYFKSHEDNLVLVSHADEIHRSIVSLVRCQDENITDTFCFVCNLDTSGNDEYGVLKQYAFTPDLLKEKLKSFYKNKSKEQTELSYDSNLYGLGSFQDKAVAGTLLTLIKESSDQLSDLPFNLMLICTTQSISCNDGIKECLPYIKSILTDQGLDIKLTIGFKPETTTEDENKVTLYTSNLGMAEFGFFILGEETEKTKPFNGFSPSQIAARIIEKIEYNSDLIPSNSKPFVPVLNSFMQPHPLSSGTHSCSIVSFDIPFINLNLSDLIEKFKAIAASSLEESCLAIENRQAQYKAKLQEEFNPLLRDAEVLSYSDLMYRAQKRYRGDLDTDMQRLLDHCNKENYSDNMKIHALLTKLCKLIRLPRPSVIVYLGRNFTPQQMLRQTNSDDREMYMHLSSTVENFNRDHVLQIKFGEHAPSSECCFMRPFGADHAGSMLSAECPVPCHPFYNFGCPAVTLTYRGDDLTLPTEHVSSEIFELLPSFIIKLFEEFQQQTLK